MNSALKGLRCSVTLARLTEYDMGTKSVSDLISSCAYVHEDKNATWHKYYQVRVFQGTGLFATLPY